MSIKVCLKAKYVQRLMLEIKAELENVTDLAPASDTYEYFFQVRLRSDTPCRCRCILLIKLRLGEMQ